MNTSGEAADQVVRISMEVGEAALKITGAGAKQLAVLLYAVLKEQKKTKGRARLETLIRSGKPLTVYSVKESDLKEFVAEAKRYGVLYCAVRNPRGSADGMVDVIVRAEDASRINRIVDRFQFATVTEAAQIKTEIEQSRAEKSHQTKEKPSEEKSGKERAASKPPHTKEEQADKPKEKKGLSGQSQSVPQQEHPEKSQEDKLMDELFGEVVKQEGKPKKPSLAKTGNAPLSEPISKRPEKAAGDTSKKHAPLVPEKPSVRRELREIEAARKKEGESKSRESVSKEKMESTRQTRHTQPQNRKKSAKSKER